MARTGRPGLSSTQKRELWSRWRAGETLSEIGRALEKHAGSIHGILSAHGGISPAVRRRAPQALTLAEREDVSRGLVAGASIRALSRQLGRAPSTISREVLRNGGRTHYRAVRAEERAASQARRPKPCWLALQAPLRLVVATKLKADWSPAQIAGWLELSYGRDSTMRVSHETIYRSLFLQARGVLERCLLERLRSGRLMRRGKRWSTAGQRRGQIIDAAPISSRPAEIDSRAVPGHWEGDLISGAKNSHIATLVERHSRYVRLVRVVTKDSASVVAALVREVRQLPQGAMTSLTWDRGTELALHKAFTLATNVAVYFCNPKSPWERGTNENTNGLLRQYFPEGVDLASYTQEALDVVAQKLNTRPRKVIGFHTPADHFHQSVALTG